MKFFVLSLVTILQISCATSRVRPATGSAGSTTEKAVEGLVRHKLSNGIVVLAKEDHTVPMVSYRTCFRVGSVDEKPGLTGMAHLFEHLMFKGTETEGPKPFFEKLEKKGAEVNALTTNDYTCYYVNASKQLLPTIIELDSDRLLRMAVTESELDIEKHVVLEERLYRIESVPGARMQETLWGHLFRKHPYRFPTSGVPQDLLSVRVEDLTDFWKEHYHAATLAITVVGDFSTPDLMDALEKAYGSVPKNPLPPRNFETDDALSAEKRVELFDQVPTESVLIGYPITEAGHSDSYPLDLLSMILFQGTSSRGTHRLVEEQQSALDVSASSFTPKYPGVFTIGATTRKPFTTEQLLEEIDRIVRDVAEKGVTDEEVQTARKRLSLGVYRQLATPDGFAANAATVEMILGDGRRYHEDLERYAEVTREDIRRVAKRYLDRIGRVVVIMRPKALSASAAGAGGGVGGNAGGNR